MGGTGSGVTATGSQPADGEIYKLVHDTHTLLQQTVGTPKPTDPKKKCTDDQFMQAQQTTQATLENLVNGGQLQLGGGVSAGGRSSGFCKDTSPFGSVGTSTFFGVHNAMPPGTTYKRTPVDEFIAAGVIVHSRAGIVHGGYAITDLVDYGEQLLSSQRIALVSSSGVIFYITNGAEKCVVGAFENSLGDSGWSGTCMGLTGLAKFSWLQGAVATMQARVAPKTGTPTSPKP